MSSDTAASRRDRAPWIAALVCALLGAIWATGVSAERSWGWDESMHAELPAARMLLAARAGAWSEASDVLLDCQQYPFVYPVLLALVQGVTGIDEHATRVFGRCVWAFGLLGIFLLARELVRVRRERGGKVGEPAGASAASPLDRAAPLETWERVAPWLALTLAALSPLAVAYSGTLFLEAPFAAFSAFALRAWLRRQRAERRAWHELAAGAWMVPCLFTKWNYGLLLGFGLFLDWLVELVLELRARRGPAFARRSLLLALIPALAIAWWFVLPLPAGAEMGAAHRATLLSFLGGNEDASMRTAWQERLLHWTCFFALDPRMLLIQALALVCALPLALRAGARTLWIVFLAAGTPVWTHNFHLDRFLLPGGIALWCLAALGLARVLPARPKPLAACLALLALAALAWPSLDGTLLFKVVMGAPKDAATAQYRRGIVAGWADLSPGRELRTAGLRSEESKAVLDLLAKAAGPNARVAWLGVNPEFSPAAIHLGLLVRGGSAERFRRDAGRIRSDGKPDMLVTHEFLDPGWKDEQIRAWARAFQLVFTTQPMDWKGRKQQEVLARYRDALLAGGGWRHESLGKVEILRPPQAPLAVEVFACRPEKP